LANRRNHAGGFTGLNQSGADPGAAAAQAGSRIGFSEDHMNTVDGKTLQKQAGNILLKSKPALLLTLFALLIPTQIVMANPSPLPEQRLIDYFLNNFLIVFLLTFGIEFVIISTRGLDKSGNRNLGIVKTAFAVAAINLLTLSCLWLFIRHSTSFYSQNFLLGVLILEFTIVWVEALFYKYCFQLGMRQAFVLSIWANLASYFVGVVFLAIAAPRPHYNTLNDIKWD
jgi:hypothetical protein